MLWRATVSAMHEFLSRFTQQEHAFESQQYLSGVMAGLLGCFLIGAQLARSGWYHDARAAFGGLVLRRKSGEVVIDEAQRPPLLRVMDWARQKGSRRLRQLFQAVLLLGALISCVNYFYASHNDGVYVHRWDVYHTVIGAKYFDELGYGELYRCSLVADAEETQRFTHVKKLRNLHSRRHEPRKEHLQGNKCRDSFSEARWNEFKSDLKTFAPWMNRASWAKLFSDKGFNGTPFYTVLARALVAIQPLTHESLLRLSLIDPVLMVGAFAAVAWAYGANTAAIVAIFFCVFFPNRYEHMGGSILRFDYVAALIAGTACLKKERWGWAGALFAWATMVRVFPLVFAGAVVLKILVEVFETQKLSPQHRRFVISYGAGTLLMFVISLIALEGTFSNWLEWAEDMRIHNMKSAGFRVGFKHLFMFDGELGHTSFGKMQRLFEERQAYYWIGVACLMGPILLSIRRLDTPTFAVLLGVCAFFTLTVATRYYYGVVALLFMMDRRILQNRYMLIMGALLFAMNVFSFEYYGIKRNDAVLYNNVVSLQLTFVFTLIAIWLLMNPGLEDSSRQGARSLRVGSSPNDRPA